MARRPGAVALGFRLGSRGVKIFAFALIFLLAVVAVALFVNAFGPAMVAAIKYEFVWRFLRFTN